VPVARRIAAGHVKLSIAIETPKGLLACERIAVDAFEEGVKHDTASVNLDGKMVDVPVYRRAQLILQRANAIADLERTKAEALKRLGPDRRSSCPPRHCLSSAR
jgi:citrate lyase beta subunit